MKVWQKDEALAVRPASWRKQLSEAQAEGQVEAVMVVVVVSARASVAASVRAAMRWEMTCSSGMMGLLILGKRDLSDQG